MVLFLYGLLWIEAGFLLRGCWTDSTRRLPPGYLLAGAALLLMGIPEFLRDPTTSLPGLFLNPGALLVGIYLASQIKGSPLERRRIRKAVFGYTLVTLCVQLQVIHRPVLLNIPLPLDRAGEVSGTFKADLSVPCQVLLVVDRNLPFEEIEALANYPTADNPLPSPNPNRPEIYWTLERAWQGTPASWSPAYYGSDIGIALDSSGALSGFDAMAGRTYTIYARVTNPQPKLRVLNPHLQVRTHSFEDRNTSYSAFFIGLIGLVILYKGFVRPLIGASV